MIGQTVVDGGKPHLVLIPLMAHGHMIPMVDMARLLAHRGGALVTFVTTPLNASRIKPTIDRAHQSGLPIRFVTLRFPSAEAGLPDGCESADTLPSGDLMRNFFDAAGMLRDPLIHHLRSHGPPPSCIIADACHPWAHDVARAFRVPRLVFHGFGCFALLCLRNIQLYKIHDNTKDPNQPVPVPGMPHRVEIASAQTFWYTALPSIEEFGEEMRQAEEAADGVVVNSSDDLEPPYREWYRKSVGKKVWTIGPMLLHNRDAAEVALRGKASIDESRCRSWLDSMKPSSVLYVCFGSVASTATAQLIEIGLGLEASDRPFIWVIKAGDRMAEVEEWLSQGFEERTDGRGLVIRGWAPQVTILFHPAVGGFMTHCGWNSTLEGMSAGVPLITWPHFAEQFLNEKLTVEVLRIGVPIGAKSPNFWGSPSEAKSEVVVVGRQDVEKAVRELMDEGKEGEERRERARELEKKARRAMEEGGSSHANLKLLIQHISEISDNHIDQETNGA